MFRITVHRLLGLHCSAYDNSLPQYLGTYYFATVHGDGASADGGLGNITWHGPQVIYFTRTSIIGYRLPRRLCRLAASKTASFRIACHLASSVPRAEQENLILTPNCIFGTGNSTFYHSLSYVT